MKKTDIAKKMVEDTYDKYMSKRREARKNGGHVHYKTYSEMLGKKSGKASLNMPKGEKNMGEKMMLGKDEHNRA